jgi:cyclohexa-1,5-dienecarbonyl-CoA hydratase
MNAFEFIQWQIEGGVARLTLNRPPLNILHIAMMEEIHTALSALTPSPPSPPLPTGPQARYPGERELRDEGLQPRLLVIAAQGRAFSAGVDVADHTADRVEAMMRSFDRIFLQLHALDIPTLAAVQGPALGGGCELALACDLIVASEAASFAQPEIRLGVIAPYACIRLPQLIGPKQAAELLLTGATLSAAEAAQLGLVNRVVPAAELPAAVEALIGQLVGLSGAALALCKRAMRFASQPFAEALAAVERLYLEDLMATADAHEGLAAFLEKRKPVWRNS